MPDNLGQLPVKTKTAGDVVAKIVDTAGTNEWTINASGAGLVDTELPAAAALADGASNPTAPAVGSFGMVWNGTTWDRMKGTAGVVLVSDASASLGTAKIDTLSSTSVAPAASVNLDASAITSTKTGYLASVIITASGPVKWEIQTYISATPTTVVVGFSSSADATYTYETPALDYITIPSSGGSDLFRVKITNMDNSNTFDVYSTICWRESV